MARPDDGSGANGEDEKLANVYFSYSSLEDAYAATGGPGAGGAASKRPGSTFNKRPAASAKASARSVFCLVGARLAHALHPFSASPPQGLTSTAAGRRDPTNIGTLRDSVAFNEAEEVERRRQAASTPKARGLVKDTVDPRLRKSVAK